MQKPEVLLLTLCH